MRPSVVKPQPGIDATGAQRHGKNAKNNLLASFPFTLAILAANVLLAAART